MAESDLVFFFSLSLPFIYRFGFILAGVDSFDFFIFDNESFDYLVMDGLVKGAGQNVCFLRVQIWPVSDSEPHLLL